MCWTSWFAALRNRFTPGGAQRSRRSLSRKRSQPLGLFERLEDRIFLGSLITPPISVGILASDGWTGSPPSVHSDLNSGSVASGSQSRVGIPLSSDPFLHVWESLSDTPHCSRGAGGFQGSLTAEAEWTISDKISKSCDFVSGKSSRFRFIIWEHCAAICWPTQKAPGRWSNSTGRESSLSARFPPCLTARKSPRAGEMGGCWLSQVNVDFPKTFGPSLARDCRGIIREKPLILDSVRLKLRRPRVPMCNVFVACCVPSFAATSGTARLSWCPAF